ncbi:MAG: hypothetical protein ABI880_14775, partial [Acidobacteriota bacterium]
MLSRRDTSVTTRAVLVGAIALVTAVGAMTAQVPAVRTSEAERRYVAPHAFERVATGPRTVTLSPGYGRKFAAENTRPTVTISNPYMNPARPIFAKVEHMECTADGGLVVGGR